jgi:TolA-binding protein
MNGETKPNDPRDARSAERHTRPDGIRPPDGATHPGPGRADLSSRVAGAEQEMTELRQRQEQIERTRQRLEELSQRQKRYETAKRATLASLERGVVWLENQQARARQTAEMLGVMREEFRNAARSLGAVDESGWRDATLDVDLSRALATVEEAQAVYRKGTARIQAAGWFRAAGEELPERAAGLDAQGARSRGFWAWAGIGLAFTLPAVVVAFVLFALWVYFTGIV